MLATGEVVAVPEELARIISPIVGIPIRYLRGAVCAK